MRRSGWKRGHTVAAVLAGVVLVGGGVGVAVGSAGNGEPASALSPGGPSRSGSRETSGSDTPSSPSSAAVPRVTPRPRPKPTPTRPPVPTDPLSGGRLSEHEVLAVKVENIAAARPQIGLDAADIVFIEEVEGAQTRLIAVYHTTFPRVVEPVRSARSTDAQLLPLFGKPGLVYSGANKRVQAKIDRASIVGIYRQTRDRNRVAPHNVRVDLAEVATSVKAGRAQPIGWTFRSGGNGLGSAAKAEVFNTTVGRDTFSFDYHHGRYTVRWKGKPYADGISGALTKADNVAVMDVRNHHDGNRDVLGAASVQSDTVGRGRVALYRDGRKLTGTWERKKVGAQLHFTDREGHDLALKPGQTWVALRGR